MYRVFAILFAGLFLSACGSVPDWMKINTDAFKPKALTDAVRFESEPPGAEAKIAGQSCRTPCSLQVPIDAKMSVTFSLAGYQPDTEELVSVSQGDGLNHLAPNPVLAELTPAPPPPKPKTAPKPVVKKKTTAKPKATTAAPAAAAAPAGQQTPWPGAPAQR